MSDEVQIILKKYDERNNIAFIKKNEKNLFSDLEICAFSEEMDYWDIPIKAYSYEGEMGYVFNSSIDKELLCAEIRRFIFHNNL